MCVCALKRPSVAATLIASHCVYAIFLHLSLIISIIMAADTWASVLKGNKNFQMLHKFSKKYLLFFSLNALYTRFFDVFYFLWKRLAF